MIMMILVIVILLIIIKHNTNNDNDIRMVVALAVTVLTLIHSKHNVRKTIGSTAVAMLAGLSFGRASAGRADCAVRSR